ncbi:hypothetical protein EB796_015334 [Bugula neritina]|uniref:Uncharacterized protein n=1 Tax=Bugula neritina TaxID=10212 RepID=A0A7J7JJ96_BUGNE|nr:hypothetical protein EB796_015334 [Bugula neritina]
MIYSGVVFPSLLVYSHIPRSYSFRYIICYTIRNTTTISELIVHIYSCCNADEAERAPPTELLVKIM